VVLSFSLAVEADSSFALEEAEQACFAAAAPAADEHAVAPGVAAAVAAELVAAAEVERACSGAVAAAVGALAAERLQIRGELAACR